MGAKNYTEGKYFVTGEITEIKNTTYGNLYIKDANGVTFYVYGLYTMDGATRFDAMTTQPKVGDTVTIYGEIGTYNGTEAQMQNGWLVTTPAADTEIAIPGANTLGLAQGHNKYTADKYIVTGTITEIANTQYGNLYIKDAKDNTFYLYGLYSADGSVRFDKMEAQPKVGDTITVIGIIGQYKGTAQMKNAWLYVAPEGGDNTDTPTTPDLSTTKGIYDAAALLENNVNLAGGPYTMTGEIVSVDTAYSAEHGNVTVSIVVDGYTFKCYRLAGTGADVIAVGDTITVTGEITAYYSAPQFAQGSTLVSYEKAPEEDEVVDGTKVTVTIGDYATTNSWENATKYLTITMDENITVTATGGDNTGKYYTNGNNWRIYQNETPAVTITAANGKTIKSVKITYASHNNGVLTMNGNNVANATAVEVNAASVTFSVGNTGTADNGQARITAIEVIYA